MKIKENLPIIIAGIIFLAFLITPIMYNSRNIKNLKESEQSLGGRSGGTGVSIGMSVTEQITASYTALQLISGSTHVTEMFIGNEISGRGLILMNATTSDFPVFTLKFNGLKADSYEINRDFSLGVLITTSEGIYPSFNYQGY